MIRKKKDIIYPKLRNSKGDMNATWYIEFSIRNHVSGKMERKRIYEGFKDIPTYQGRMDHAKKLIKEYTDMIDKGEINLSEHVVYKDELNFQTSSSRNREQTGDKDSFRVIVSQFIVYKRSEISEKSLQTYRSRLRLFGEFLEDHGLDKKPLMQVKNEHVIKFLKACADTGLARKTIEKYQQILYAFFKWVIDNEKAYMNNPATNIPRLGMVKDESAPALTEDIRAILQYKMEREDPQLWLACCFQYYCAIRPGTELRLLKIKDINMMSRTITVRNYLAKNDRTETIDMPGQLFNMLVDFAINKYDGNLYLFGHDFKPGHNPLGRNAMSKRFNKIRDEAGISSEVKYYSWKHSGAQELRRAGANIYSIQRHLRHKSLSTTEKYFNKRFGGGDKQIRDEFPDI